MCPALKRRLGFSLKHSCQASVDAGNIRALEYNQLKWKLGRNLGFLRSRHIGDFGPFGQVFRRSRKIVIFAVSLVFISF
jgi:hypothetical protein